MGYLTADHIFIHGAWKQDAVLHLADDGNKIIEIHESTSGLSDVHKIEGAVIPGFINAHCHLELSHMRGLIPSGTGLIDFIFSVFSQRDFPDETIEASAKKADLDMYTAGIDAVGDICNTLYSQEAKLNSKMRYASFVEAYDLWQGLESNDLWEGHLTTYAQLRCKPGDYKSLAPHAPYSVSPDAFARLNEKNSRHTRSTSVHNQETPDENKFFLTGAGDLRRFYTQANLPLERYTAPGCRSLDYLRKHMDADRRTLLVHNTMSTADDVQKTLEWNPQTYWVTCPNANLYIENRLPDYQMLIDQGAKIAIGTDSLSSNWQLSILDEIKSISQYCSYISTEDLLTWATLHGAQALGFDDLGLIAPGYSPGLLQMNYNPEQESQLSRHHEVQRLT